MKVLSLDIAPQPWRRTRGGGNARYTDAKTRAYKEAIALRVKSLFGQPPLQGPVSLGLEFHFQIPKSWTKKKKANPPAHTSRPDLDNLVKAVKDALNGIAWIDDSQVVLSRAEKLYAEQPGIKISIQEV